MKKDNDYTYKQIEAHANEHQCDMSEYGNGTLGHSFLTIEYPNNGKITSFILTGYNSAEGNIYTCIYNQ